MAENKTQAQAVGTGDVETLRADLAAARAEAEEARQALRKADAEREAAARELKTLREEAAMQAVREEKRAMHQLRQQEKVLLTINSQPNDSTPVMVSVNGYAYRIKRDEPVLVPRAVAEMLKLAVMDVPQVVHQDNGQEKTVFRHVNRFSFSVEVPAEQTQAEAV
ncbi:hypothetical protein [uncultured Desulfovibrio sp.]|uniref:hypothetical protein n=1 Tax=uncultured Desulfovibrio sp. TaxID=167968 RepID=UPI002609923D|nr:hypothetical protein [uncultured Desulfovibrio sp.]